MYYLDRLFTCGCRRASELRQLAVVALLIAGIVQKERAVVLAGWPSILILCADSALRLVRRKKKTVAFAVHRKRCIVQSHYDYNRLQYGTCYLVKVIVCFSCTCILARKGEGYPLHRSVHWLLSIVMVVVRKMEKRSTGRETRRNGDRSVTATKGTFIPLCT